jgi:TPR repeat protein
LRCRLGRAATIPSQNTSQGSAGAQYNIGLLYNEGKGIAQDYERVLKWYILAAEQGNILESDLRTRKNG